MIDCLIDVRIHENIQRLLEANILHAQNAKIFSAQKAD